MSETFTPGPWQLSGMAERGLYGNGGELAVVGPNDRICNVDCVAEFKRGMGHVAKCVERDANAHLIASAPDLYAALQEVRRVGDDKMAFKSEWLAAIAKADAALAKARGEPA